MTCSDKYITLFRGDDTNFNGQQFLTFNLDTEVLNLSECKAQFTLGNIIQTIDDISDGSFQVNFTSAQTASMPSTGFAKLAVIDGTGKHGTLSNTIPYRVVSQTHNNAIVTEPYTLNFDVKQGGETILNVNVEAGVSVEVAGTVTLPAGSDAEVENIGTPNHLNLLFKIPQGIQGEQGQDGKDGTDGKDGKDGVDGKDGADGHDATINGVNTLTVNASNGITLTQNGSTATISGATLENNKMDKLNPSGSGVFTLNGGTALGVNSIAIGENSTAWNDNTFSEGASDNKALEIVTNQDIDNAVNQDNPDPLITAWETDKFTLAGGFASHSEGQNCLALGTNSHAEGNGTVANHSSAHAEGTGSFATGKYSHAGGLETVASGQGSFAHGQRVRATAGNAIVIGYNETNFADNNATGFCSVVIGRNSKASGEDSVAIGKGLISSDSSRIVVGKYNEDKSGSLFVVGNGGGSNSRRNAFYVDTSGKAYIYGNLSGSDNEKALVDLKYLRQYAQEYLPNQKILTKSADVNDAKEAGFYRVAFTYNLNGEYTYGEMVSIPYKSTEEGNNNHYGAQLFFANGDYTDGRQNCFWYRTINGTTWNSWIKFDPTKIVKSVNNTNPNSSGNISISIPTDTGDLTNNAGFITDAYHDSTKQNVTDNNLNTTAQTIVGAINEVDSIALGANQAVSYADIQAMVTAFNALDDDVYRVGQNIYIVTTDVPDLWVSSIESTSSTYTYTTDSAFTSALATNGYVQVGYYKLSTLETQKVDLTNYVTNTSYADTSTAGVVKVNSGYGVKMLSNNTLATQAANNNGIAAKANDYYVITPSNLDYAVKVGVTTNVNTLTNTEKNNACSWLGTKQIVSLTQADYDALVSGGTVDASTLYIIIEATP